MTALLDSQAILWAVYEPEKLSSVATELIRDKRNTLLVSDCSLWEISLKLMKGKLEYESSLTRLHSRIAELGTTSLPITSRHIDASVRLPFLHKDPFDRLLVAQAQLEGVALISCDADVMRYDVQFSGRPSAHSAQEGPEAEAHALELCAWKANRTDPPARNFARTPSNDEGADSQEISFFSVAQRS